MNAAVSTLNETSVLLPMVVEIEEKWIANSNFGKNLIVNSKSFEQEKKEMQNLHLTGKQTSSCAIIIFVAEFIYFSFSSFLLFRYDIQR